MTGLDLLLIAVALTALGIVAWVAYSVGMTAGRREAQSAVATQRQALLSMRRQLDDSRAELAQLRRAVRSSQVIQPQPPAWMRGNDA